MSVETYGHIERGALLRESGISPVDLTNWVARGLLPRPSQRYFKGSRGSRSYYPAWAVELARDIKQMRSWGVSGVRVRKVLRGEEPW